MSSSSSPSQGKFSAPIDLRRVRRLFARPQRIEGSDFLRREISARMQERLALVKIVPDRLIDAGCGDGADLADLKIKYAQAHAIGIDASEQMLQAARRKLAASASTMRRILGKVMPGMAPESAADFVCGNFAALPLPPGSMDLVWSNLALHWHPQPDAVFAEWRRVLRVEGLLMFSCFGPDTFKEMRAAFAIADAAPHVLPFVDMHDFGDMLVNAGFSTPVMDMENITVVYDTVDKLMTDLRAWGGNPLTTQRTGLVGRKQWQRVMQAFEQMRRTDGKIPLTFEVLYGHAFRPAPRMTASGEAIIRFK